MQNTVLLDITSFPGFQSMPQFTFACFCGLHGFCNMKPKKEEPQAEQETSV
ncbi:bladder cancer associated transcript 1 isoform X1 [Pyxicephalus adspersus]|uniref:bladder cancer associated transcript 1 isoform X1 n=1 Tax=Pyxicephalus adspersus TaxID=30357 RepID=UPI003B5A3C78